jgi:hypothetical protein
VTGPETVPRRRIAAVAIPGRSLHGCREGRRDWLRFAEGSSGRAIAGRGSSGRKEVSPKLPVSTASSGWARFFTRSRTSPSGSRDGGRASRSGPETQTRGSIARLGGHGDSLCGNRGLSQARPMAADRADPLRPRPEGFDCDTRRAGRLVGTSRSQMPEGGVLTERIALRPPRDGFVVLTVRTMRGARSWALSFTFP